MKTLCYNCHKKITVAIFISVREDAEQTVRVPMCVTCALHLPNEIYEQYEDEIERVFGKHGKYN